VPPLRRLGPYLIALAVFALDRFTKHLIETRVTLWDSIPVLPGIFYIVHTRNRGAAFGMLNDSTHPLRTLLLIGVSTIVLIAIGFVIWNPPRWGFSTSRLALAGLALVLGGALGNVYDRVLAGSVTDFLQVFIGSYEFPSFNVADSAITVGSGLLLIELWISHRRQSSSPSRSPAT
jgi:signal peptidase II